MDTPVIIANGDAMVLPCLFQIKVCITYDEVNSRQLRRLNALGGQSPDYLIPLSKSNKSNKQIN